MNTNRSSKKSAHCTAPRTVLLIEDDQDLGHALTAHITGHGHNVVLSRNGLSGLIKSRHHRPDAVVLDLGLPRLHGLDVLHKLRTTRGLETVPVIVITGSLEPGVENQARHNGVQAILRKPFRHEDLLAAIDGALKL